MHRREWAATDVLIRDRDRHWGVPIHDDRMLFEMHTIDCFRYDQIG